MIFFFLTCHIEVTAEQESIIKKAQEMYKRVDKIFV